MSDPQGIAELAIFDALTAGVTLAPVYQDVPDGTVAPVVILAELAGDPLGGKKSRSMQLDMTITTEVWKESRKPILDLQDEVKTTLDGQKFVSGGYEISPIFLGSEARQVATGQYFGTSNFTVFVTPA